MPSLYNSLDDVIGMKRPRLTFKEFAWYAWPELPASRVPNVTAEWAWSQATLNSLAGLDETLYKYRGQRFELVSLRFVREERYPSYTEALRLVDLVGIQALYAAYFLGLVDRIGGPPPATAAPAAPGATP